MESRTGPARVRFAPRGFHSGPRTPRRRSLLYGKGWRCRPPTGEGAGYRPAHVRNALASHTGGDTQDEARAALHGVRIPQARCVRAASRGAVHIARLTRGRSPATLAVIRSEAELRSLEAASFNPRMVRRIATGARDTLLTDDRLHHR